MTAPDTISHADERRQAWLARYRRDTKVAKLDVAKVLDALAAQTAVGVRPVAIDWAAFDAYCAQADYSGRHPHYTREFGTGVVFLGKALEHFLSLQLLDPQPGQVVMDVAASHSPCHEIFVRLRGVARVYRQDLNYKPGINGDSIGSPASTIPLGNASVHAIMLHNSWEHFEGDEDVAFLLEARRLLPPGGRLVIIPLYLKDRMEIWTAPSVWATKFVATAAPPVFDPRATIVVREDQRQRQAKFFDIANLLADLGRVRGMRWEVVHFTSAAEREFGFPFTLVATREA